jgi:hypothetical protein
LTDTPLWSTGDSRLERAVALVRSLPLRWSDRDAGEPAEAVIARGWFSGASECARVLASQARLDTDCGGGFGTSWPFLHAGGWTVAPVLPVAVSAKAAVGVDGGYRCDATGVWREAGGVEDLFLTSDPSRPPPGAPFDILWFGDFERFVVRDGTLEIEDLFGVLRTPASPPVLDRHLVRNRRVGADVLVDLPLADGAGPQTVEVRRAENLSQDARWRDPSKFLAARADVVKTFPRGAEIAALAVGGTTATFVQVEDENGWSLKLQEGDYVFTEIRATCHQKTISLNATLNSKVDALAPGMRGRLIFDLRTDLVALG